MSCMSGRMTALPEQTIGTPITRDRRSGARQIELFVPDGSGINRTSTTRSGGERPSANAPINRARPFSTRAAVAAPAGSILGEMEEEAADLPRYCPSSTSSSSTLPTRAPTSSPDGGHWAMDGCQLSMKEAMSEPPRRAFVRRNGGDGALGRKPRFRWPSRAAPRAAATPPWLSLVGLPPEPRRLLSHSVKGDHRRSRKGLYPQWQPYREGRAARAGGL